MSGLFGGNSGGGGGGGLTTVLATGGIKGTGVMGDPITENFDNLPAVVYDNLASFVIADDSNRPHGAKISIQDFLNQLPAVQNGLKTLDYFNDDGVNITTIDSSAQPNLNGVTNYILNTTGVNKVGNQNLDFIDSSLNIEIPPNSGTIRISGVFFDAYNDGGGVGSNQDYKLVISIGGYSNGIALYKYEYLQSPFVQTEEVFEVYIKNHPSATFYGKLITTQHYNSVAVNTNGTSNIAAYFKSIRVEKID